MSHTTMLVITLSLTTYCDGYYSFSEMSLHLR